MKSSDGTIYLDSIVFSMFSTLDVTTSKEIAIKEIFTVVEDRDKNEMIGFLLSIHIVLNYNGFLLFTFYCKNEFKATSQYFSFKIIFEMPTASLVFEEGKCKNALYIKETFIGFLFIVLNHHFRLFKETLGSLPVVARITFLRIMDDNNIPLIISKCLFFHSIIN